MGNFRNYRSCRAVYALQVQPRYTGMRHRSPEPRIEMVVVKIHIYIYIGLFVNSYIHIGLFIPKKR